MLAKDKLIVALDVFTIAQAERLLDLLADRVSMFKVGLQLMHSAGPEVVELIHQRQAKVFADLKFHDIPHTVAQAARAITRRGVAMFNLHVAGGKDMLVAAAQAAREEAALLGTEPPAVLGVTVLTSLNSRIVREEIGIPKPIPQLVRDWVLLAVEAGLDGVISSPHEIEVIREACGPDFIIVTPGVRPSGGENHDQERVMTPGEAVRKGATYIVVGRPITGATDPRRACDEILEEIEMAMKS